MMNLPELPLEISQRIFDMLGRSLDVVLALRLVSRSFLNLTHLWRVRLFGWPKLKSEKLENIYLRILPNLEELNIFECPYLVLSRCSTCWKTLSSVRSLVVTQATASDIKELAHMHHLQRLSLKKVHLSGAVARAISSALPNLIKLSLDTVELVVGEDLSALTALYGLRSISIGRVNGAVGALLQLLPRLSRLNELKLKHSLGRNDDRLQAWQLPFVHLRQLSTLVVRGAEREAGGFAPLLGPLAPAFLAYPHLHTLHLTLLRVDGSFFQRLAQATQLRELVLSLQVNGMEAITSLSALTRLHTLGLDLSSANEREPQNGPAAATDFVTGLTALRSLALRSVHVPAGVAGLSLLQHMKLVASTARDHELARLSALPHLRELHLAACPNLTAAAFAHLARMSALTSLRLSMCDGVAPLERLTSLTALCVLDISASSARDSDLYALVSRLLYLHSLTLRSCVHVSAECRADIATKRVWQRFD